MEWFEITNNHVRNALRELNEINRNGMDETYCGKLTEAEDILTELKDRMDYLENNKWFNKTR